MGRGVGQKKTKQSVGKEIANKLEPQPIKLKISRAGSKILGGQQNKEPKKI